MLGGRSGAAAPGLGGHGLSRASRGSCLDTLSQNSTELKERFHRNAPFGWKQPLWLCWELCLAELWLLTFVTPRGARCGQPLPRALLGPSQVLPSGAAPNHLGDASVHARDAGDPPGSPSQGLQQVLEQKLQLLKVFIPPACSHRPRWRDPTAVPSHPAAAWLSGASVTGGHHKRH